MSWFGDCMRTVRGCQSLGYECEVERAGPDAHRCIAVHRDTGERVETRAPDAWTALTSLMAALRRTNDGRLAQIGISADLCERFAEYGFRLSTDGRSTVWAHRKEPPAWECFPLTHGQGGADAVQLSLATRLDEIRAEADRRAAEARRAHEAAVARVLRWSNATVLRLGWLDITDLVFRQFTAEASPSLPYLDVGPDEAVHLLLDRGPLTPDELVDLSEDDWLDYLEFAARKLREFGGARFLAERVALRSDWDAHRRWLADYRAWCDDN